MYFARVGVDWLVIKQEIKGERLHNWLCYILISSHHHIITTIMDSAARTLIALKKKKCTPSVKSIRRTTGGKKLDSFVDVKTTMQDLYWLFILLLPHCACFVSLLYWTTGPMATIILFYFLNKMTIQFKLLFLQDNNPILIFCLFHCFDLFWFDFGYGTSLIKKHGSMNIFDFAHSNKLECFQRWLLVIFSVEAKLCSNNIHG